MPFRHPGVIKSVQKRRSEKTRKIVEQESEGATTINKEEEESSVEGVGNCDDEGKSFSEDEESSEVEERPIVGEVERSEAYEEEEKELTSEAWRNRTKSTKSAPRADEGVVICPSSSCPEGCQRFLAIWRNGRCDVDAMSRLLLLKLILKVIETPRILYGCPERLFNMLLSKVRTTKSRLFSEFHRIRGGTPTNS